VRSTSPPTPRSCWLAGRGRGPPAFSNLFVGDGVRTRARDLAGDAAPAFGGRAPGLARPPSRARGRDDRHAAVRERPRTLSGRGRGIRTPLSVIEGRPLSNTAGTVLDPIVSLRHRVAIPSQGTVRLVFTTLVARTGTGPRGREKYRQPATFERASALAWTQAQVQLHHLRITRDEAHLFQRLANRLLYVDRTLRAGHQELPRTTAVRPALGSRHLRRSADRRGAHRGGRGAGRCEADPAGARVLAHEGVSADLVILNAKRTSYAQDLQQSVEAMVRASQSASDTRRMGTWKRLRAAGGPPAASDLAVLRSAARVLILANRERCPSRWCGSRCQGRSRFRRVSPAREKSETPSPPALDLEFWNGLGGFTPTVANTSRSGQRAVDAGSLDQCGREPGIRVPGLRVGLGIHLVREQPGEQAHAWSNDWVSDTPGEAFYVRDEDSGLVWARPVSPSTKKPDLCHKARPGIQSLRARIPRHRARPARNTQHPLTYAVPKAAVCAGPILQSEAEILIGSRSGRVAAGRARCRGMRARSDCIPGRAL